MPEAAVAENVNALANANIQAQQSDPFEGLTAPTFNSLPTGVQARVGQDRRSEILRVTPAAVTYDASPTNPRGLVELCTAINANLQRDDISWRDVESGTTVSVGDLYSVAIQNEDEIVIRHRDTAGKGVAGRFMTSLGYVLANPIKTTLMKTGFKADVEDVYLQQFLQFVTQLDREGQFLNPSGERTFKVDNYDWTTSTPWRDIVIKPKATETANEQLETIPSGKLVSKRVSEDSSVALAA